MKAWDMLTRNSLIHPHASFSKTFESGTPRTRGGACEASLQMTPWLPLAYAWRDNGDLPPVAPDQKETKDG